MRSPLIILCTVLALVLAFVGYLMFQKSAPRHPIPPALDSRAVRPATAPANPNIPVTSGENVFVETYDKDTHLLASRFRAAQYDPQPDGSTVDVKKPEAEFYLDKSNGRVIRLRGTTGQVIVPASPGAASGGAGGGGGGGRNQMPTRGKLHDVVLMLFATRNASTPSLTCRMNNVSFDTDTFRITTDAYTDPTSGKQIAADEVPVEVRGNDYDFDGRGLTIHWDEKDRRLQLLEIAHGEKLVAKHPGAFGGGAARSSEQPSVQPAANSTPPSQPIGSLATDTAVVASDSQPPTTEPTTRRHRNVPSGTTSQRLSPASRPNLRAKSSTRPARQPAARGVAPTTAAAATTKSSHVPAPYRAVFLDNVRVMQGDQQVAQADLMNVDFLMNEDGGGGAAADHSPDKAPATTAPSTRRSGAGRNRPSTTTPQTVAPGTAPASQPDQPPITVYWTGKMRVTPPPPDADPLQPGDSMVEFVSERHAVLLHWQGSNVACASAQWHTLDDSALVRSSELVPVIRMDDPRGFTLLTPSLQYSGADHVAVTEGRSHAEIPLQQGPSSAITIAPASAPASFAPGPASQPSDIARIDWSETCTMLMVAGQAKDDLAVEQIRLDGDVSVDSSQLKLKSRQLDLVLDAEAQRKKPADAAARTSGAALAIRQVIATDDVHAVVIDPQKKEQTIDCQRLSADLDQAADGRAYLRLLNADGDVVTRSEDGELSCGHLDVTLLPSTQPSPAAGAGEFSQQMQVQTLYASQNVRGRTADGRIVEGERVKLTQTDAGPQYQITGSPSNSAAAARVSDGTNTIVGPDIALMPSTGRATVIGAGSMHGVQQQGSKQPGRPPSTQPIDVTWQKQLNADMTENEVRVFGGVTATSKLDDGSTNIANGDVLIMTLADAPATQPTTRPAKRASTTAPTGGILGDANFALFRNKLVKAVTLKSENEGPVELRSTLLNADGSLQRRINLFAPLLTYEMQTRSLTVPMAGRLLYQDERSATTQPSSLPTRAPVTQPVAPLGDTKGAMAFQWKKDFVYNDARRTATMRGDVLLVHQTPSGAEAYRMNAQQVTAEMQATDTDNIKGTTTTKPPTTARANDSSAGVKLKKLLADGSIIFNSQRLQFQADHIEFDPAAQQLVARGTERNPAVLLDNNGLSQGTFTALYYDTAKDQMRLENFRAAIRR